MRRPGHSETGVDEEDGDDEAESEPLELGRDDLAHVLIGVRCQHAVRDSCGERAEQHVDPEPHAEPREHRHPQDDEADGELSAGVHRFVHQAVDPRVRPTRREPDGHAGDLREPEQDDSRRARLASAEKQRDRQQWSELARRTDRGDGTTERCRQFAGIAEHGHERAERGRCQRHTEIDTSRRRRREHQSEHHPDGERDRPAERGPAKRSATDLGEVDLLAGEEEQHDEPEVGEHRDELARVDPPEHGRPDQQAEHDLEHDERDLHPASITVDASTAATAAAGISITVGSGRSMINCAWNHPLRVMSGGDVRQTMRWRQELVNEEERVR